MHRLKNKINQLVKSCGEATESEEENGKSKTRTLPVKYVMRVDNNSTLESYKIPNMVEGFKRFCKIAELDYKKTLFGWAQTNVSLFTWAISQNPEDVTYRLYKLSEDSKYNYHLFYDYSDFLYYLDGFGEKDPYNYDDIARFNIVNDSARSTAINKRTNPIQVMFEEDSVEEVFYSQDFKEFFKFIKSHGLVEMFNQ